MLVIGSTALRLAGIPGSKPKDLDLIGTVRDLNRYVQNRGGTLISCVYINKGKKAIIRFKDEPHIVELELAFEGTTAFKLLELLESNYKNLIINKSTELGAAIAAPSLCLAIKLSHRFKKITSGYPRINFLKTMNDIRDLRELGIHIPDVLTDWFKDREKETYNYEHPSLMQSKTDFFDPNEGVRYKYEHDDIHQAVAIGCNPAYTYFKGDDKEVMVDKEKWDNLIEGFKLNSVLEESYVLALERCLIPFGFMHPPRRAFLMALEKVCTSIASGWWREYAWENYDRVIGLYDLNYVDKFHKALAQGRIRPYQGEVRNEDSKDLSG